MNFRIVFTILVPVAFGSAACNNNSEPMRASSPSFNLTGSAALVAPSALPITVPTSTAVTKSTSTADGSQFDIASVPISLVSLPPFPYLAWPSTLSSDEYVSKTFDFDADWVLAGANLRAVEGKLEKRHFSNDIAKLSALASRRNYQAAIKALGGVKINTIEPDDPTLVKQDAERKLAVSGATSYEAYLIRTNDKNIWITVLVNSVQTYLRILEEKEMVQTVGFVASAETMRAELEASGHIALYINFDTDKAIVRGDGKRVVDEIATLLKKNPMLQLSIEGHTDNSGDSQHNKNLSEQRAAAVVSALVTSGIDKSRLTAVGQGAAKPVADNNNEAGRAKNRRVELVKVSAT